MRICFTHPFSHGREHIYTAPPQLRHKPPFPRGLNLGVYNIRNGRGFGLDQSIWAVQLIRYDVMMLTETKISDEAYCHTWLGCDMVCFLASATSARGAQGGVVLVV